MRRAVALVCSLLALSVAAPAAWAGGPDSVVNSFAPDEGQVVKHSGVNVGITNADTVDSTNLAQAYAHDCTGCEAVATSLQAVVATGHPSTVTPQNLGIAVNSNCTGCKVFAYAYQYVVTADRPLRLRPGDRDTLQDFRAEADDLTNSGLPYAELDARLHELAQRFRAAVDAVLARGKIHGDGDSHEQVRQHDDERDGED
jgi:hypothetical protein